jgi:hypothetical protein
MSNAYPSQDDLSTPDWQSQPHLYSEEHEYDEDPDQEPAPPRWTWGRFVFTLVILLMIALLLVNIILPALQVWLTPLPTQPLAPPVNL